MNRAVAGAALVAGFAAGLGHRLKAKAVGRQPYGDESDRWLTVTVNCPPGQIVTELPEPLERLRASIEVEIRPAPGDRGIELAARPRNGVPAGSLHRHADDRVRAVRSALRDAKSLIETGEILRPDAPTTKQTPGGKLIGAVTDRAGGEGRL